MIRLTDSTTKNEVRKMWKACFHDSDEFMELYFSDVYQNDNTLIYFENGQAAASLQMLPYKFTFCGAEIPVSYISGACTYPEYRNRGYMGKLLSAAFEKMRERNIPLSILIPAEKWLYGYYARYGYEKVFEEDSQIIPIKQILDDAHGNIDQAYREFDRIYRSKDFCIRKTKEQFRAIIQDAELDNFPPKTNLSGMARIIDAEQLLTLFAEKYPDKSLVLHIEDAIFSNNNTSFAIHNGSVEKVLIPQTHTLNLSINQFTQALFGLHPENVSSGISSYFPPHFPILNLMLE